MSTVKLLEYLSCHHTNPLALMYSCTCSSFIHVTIRELLTSVECLSLFKSREGVQEQTEIPEGQDRSCNCDPLLTGKDCSMMRQNNFWSLKTAYRGKLSHFPSSTHFSTVWTVLQTPGTHPKVFFKQCLVKGQDSERVCMTHTALRLFYIHKELIWN